MTEYVVPNMVFALINDRCPLRCKHCSLGYVDGYPGTGWVVTQEEMLEIVRSVDTKNNEAVCFAGGEPSLSPKLLATGIQECHARGLKAGMVTAPVWAKTREAALQYWGKLPPFDFILLSFDDYHLEFIDVAHYENAITAAETTGTKVSMVCCYSTAGERQRLLRLTRHLRRRLPWGISFAPVIPVGNGATQLPHALVTLTDVASLRSLNRTCVIGKIPVILQQHGVVGACCWSTSVVESPLRFEIVKESDGLAKTMAKMLADETASFLRRHGVIDGLTDAGAQAIVDKLRGKSYVNECHLCIDLMSAANRDLWTSCVANVEREDELSHAASGAKLPSGVRHFL